MEKEDEGHLKGNAGSGKGEKKRAGAWESSEALGSP